MQPIILALLLAGAQLPENPHRLNIKFVSLDSSDLRGKSDSLLPARPTPLTIESLVALWDTYKAECWNDSTAEREGYGTAWVHPVNPPRVVYQNYRTIYRHRHATLDGFMEFLKVNRKGVGHAD